MIFFKIFPFEAILKRNTLIFWENFRKCFEFLADLWRKICPIEQHTPVFRKFFLRNAIKHGLWGPRSSALIRASKLGPNNFRMLYNISRYEIESLLLFQGSVNGCWSIIRKLIYSFMQQLNSSENNIIMEIRRSVMLKNQTSENTGVLFYLQMSTIMIYWQSRSEWNKVINSLGLFNDLCRVC